MGPWPHCKLGPAALPCPEPIGYPVGNVGLVEFSLSLPKQDKEELMYPMEWDLPKEDKAELMMLLGMSAMEWEKRAHEESERLAEGERTRLRRIVSWTGQSGQARPSEWSFGRLVAALTWLAGYCLSPL
jgi:hypothetical protein